MKKSKRSFHKRAENLKLSQITQGSLKMFNPTVTIAIKLRQKFRHPRTIAISSSGGSPPVFIRKVFFQLNLNVFENSGSPVGTFRVAVITIGFLCYKMLYFLTNNRSALSSLQPKLSIRLLQLRLPVVKKNNKKDINYSLDYKISHSFF